MNIKYSTEWKRECCERYFGLDSRGYPVILVIEQLTARSGTDLKMAKLLSFKLLLLDFSDLLLLASAAICKNGGVTLYALLEDAQDSRTRISQREEAYASREAWAHSIGLSQIIHHDHVYAHETHIQAHQAQLQLQSTLIQTQHQAELLAHQEQQRRARQPGPDARIPDHQDASRDADSHT
ncbi:hypothetical protein Tco_1039533 [Tanacetum coccineum]